MYLFFVFIILIQFLINLSYIWFIKLLGIEKSFQKTAKELLEGIVKWFKATMGLYDHGLDIKKEITDDHAYMEEYEAMLGKRKGSNGFRYDVYKDFNVVVRV